MYARVEIRRQWNMQRRVSLDRPRVVGLLFVASLAGTGTSQGSTHESDLLRDANSGWGHIILPCRVARHGR